MSWAKRIDRRKFDRKGGLFCSWSQDARKWFCAWFPDWNGEGIDEALAAGQGDDPLEAVIAMCVDLGALAESGESMPNFSPVTKPPPM